MHMFLNFEILSSNVGLVSAFWAHHTGPSTRLFSGKNHFSHLTCTGFGYLFKKLSYQSGSGIRSKADFLHGIYVRYKPVLVQFFFFFLKRISGLGFDSFNENWRMFGQRVLAPFFSFKEPCSFGSDTFFQIQELPG
jgi:hypothetical protein